MKTYIILLVIFAGVAASGYFYSKFTAVPQSSIGSTFSEPTLPTIDCIPAFADGGGPYYRPNSPFRKKIVPDINNGHRLIVSGKILKNNCKNSVPNSIIDIWQANESGNYQDDWYRGKITSDNDGNYQFETVVPKGYGEGTGYRPPHIHFKVFVNDAEIITSQMFFPEIKGTEGFNDSYIMRIESKNESGRTVYYGTHDIVLPL